MGSSGCELTANAAALVVSCFWLDRLPPSPPADVSAALATANMTLTVVAFIDPPLLYAADADLIAVIHIVPAA